MHGIRRVLVFCTLTTVLPSMLLLIPLYLRHSFYANVAYAVTESDILEINDGVSTIFCSEHTLQMNGTFNAFQMSHRPEIASYKKHIRLKKSMNLPDDTLEYWGFYLLKGASVTLSVCSRFQGASILVVKGDRNLRTCNLLEHNNNKERIPDFFLPDADQVKVTFESHIQERNSEDVENNVLLHISEKINNTTTLKGIGFLENNVKKRINGTSEETMYSLDNIYVDERTTNMQDPSEFQVQEHIKIEQSKENRVLGNMKSKTWFQRKASRQTRKVVEHKKNNKLETETTKNTTSNITNSVQQQRHKIEKLRKELSMIFENNNSLEEESDAAIIAKTITNRLKRNQEPVQPPSILDQGIKHGGNAGNLTNEESSISSFENGLFNCYEGAILLTQEFAPSDKCINVDYLVNGKHMEARHDVVEDGYYYYIFYSDNDFVSNDIHALFDIYKPTFQYENVTKSCINQTECSFSLSLMSADRVIVEIPTKDGIDLDPDEINLLISVCHPRMGVYVIFPIAVMIFILGCAFI